MKVHDVAIIGAGPAGIAAAIQLKRYNADFIILEKNKIGGLLKNANLVENYPGFPEGISGFELIELFNKHLKNNKIQPQYENVTDVNYEKEIFEIHTEKTTFYSKTLIISSGTKPKKLSIPDDLNNKILYDVYSITEENKKIAIIGAGDCAFDYAINLSKHNEILILNRGNKLKCLPLLQERCKNAPNISYLENTIVEKIEKADDQLLLICNDAQIRINADYLIVAIGREPCLDFANDQFKQQIEHLKSIDLLFTIGDVQNDIYRQTAICIGDGIKSAMKIHKKLNHNI